MQLRYRHWIAVIGRTKQKELVVKRRGFLFSNNQGILITLERIALNASAAMEGGGDSGV